jgi:hypothetical protein
LQNYNRDRQATQAEVNAAKISEATTRARLTQQGLETQRTLNEVVNTYNPSSIYDNPRENDIFGPANSVEQVNLVELRALSQDTYDLDTLATPEVMRSILNNNTSPLERDEMQDTYDTFSPKQTITAGIAANQAAIQGVDLGVTLGMLAIESKLGIDKNTWKEDSYIGPAQIGAPEFNENASDAAKELGITDQYANIQAGISYMKSLQAGLKKSGIAPTLSNTYIAYNQGLGGARALIKNPQMTAVGALQTAGLPRKKALSHVQSNLPPGLKGRARTITAAEFSEVVGGYPEKHLNRITGGMPAPSLTTNSGAPTVSRTPNRPNNVVAPARGGSELSPGEMRERANDFDRTAKGLNNLADISVERGESPESVQDLRDRAAGLTSSAEKLRRDADNASGGVQTTESPVAPTKTPVNAGRGSTAGGPDLRTPEGRAVAEGLRAGNTQNPGGSPMIGDPDKEVRGPDSTRGGDSNPDSSNQQIVTPDIREGDKSVPVPEPDADNQSLTDWIQKKSEDTVTGVKERVQQMQESCGIGCRISIGLRTLFSGGDGPSVGSGAGQGGGNQLNETRFPTGGDAPKSSVKIEIDSRTSLGALGAEVKAIFETQRASVETSTYTYREDDLMVRATDRYFEDDVAGYFFTYSIRSDGVAMLMLEVSEVDSQGAYSFYTYFDADADGALDGFFMDGYNFTDTMLLEYAEEDYLRTISYAAEFISSAP